MPFFHNGRYEDSCGWIEPDFSLSKTDESIFVRVGFVQSKLKFRLHHLQPLKTTEHLGYISAAAAQPVVSAVGMRVVITGADTYGDTRWIGQYGLVVRSPQPTPPEIGCVACIPRWPPAPNQTQTASYFHQDSLCRSTLEF